jgi:hypothetical protein
VIEQASKYSDVRAAATRNPSTPTARTSVPPRRSRPATTAAPAVLIPKHTDLVNWEEWIWRELRDGGRLHAYLQREKATSNQRLRKVARQMHGARQNNQSDWRLVAAVPAREYQRWKKEDPHFWEDDSNLRSFRRSNPDACVYL